MDINVYVKNPKKIRDHGARIITYALGIFVLCRMYIIESRLDKMEKTLKELKPDEEA